MTSNLSRLTLGTVQFGMPYGVANRRGQPEYREVLEILDCAFQAGVNCLDTAAGYGESEEILGHALADLGIAEAVTVVTKTEPVPPDVSTEAVRRHLRDSVVRSLQKLRLKSLPLCLFHHEEDFRHVEALQELQEEGLIREIGVSVMTMEAAAAILDTGLSSAVQIPANILDHRFRKAGIPRLAVAQNCRLFVRSIYLQGLLLMPEASVPAALSDVIPVRRALAALAAEAGLSLEQLAVSYILSWPEVTSVLVGVESVEQMRHNVALFGRGPLDGELVRAVEARVPELSDDILMPTRWPR